MSTADPLTGPPSGRASTRPARTAAPPERGPARRELGLARIEPRAPGLVARLRSALTRGDPLADAAAAAVAGASPGQVQGWVERLSARRSAPGAPEPLRELLAEVAAATPGDLGRIQHGAGLLALGGPLSGVVLGLRSLVHGYVTPAGNKPLVWSGQLTGAAAGKRLAETAAFVEAVARPEGVAPGTPGLAATVRVRLMHARVRALIRATGRWPTEAWGEPINQHDMAATILLFSVVLADGLRRLGLRPPPGLLDDWAYLWRQVGLAIGVEPALLPESHAEGYAMAELILDSLEPPDDDARRLVERLLAGDPTNPPSRSRRRATEALCRHLIGDRLADQLGLTRTRLPLPALLTAAVGAADHLRRLVPGLHAVWLARGQLGWARNVARALPAGPAYGLAASLPGAPRG